MHATSYQHCKAFVDRYLADRRPLRVADVGSRGVNGTYRPLFGRPGWTYHGLDIRTGHNVDLVIPARGPWHEVPPDCYDVVVSGQTLEHVWKPWETIRQMARILKPGGLIFICVPNTWNYHAHPTDNWRFWPEGLRALFDEANIEPEKLFSKGRDTVGIGVKPDGPADA